MSDDRENTVAFWPWCPSSEYHLSLATQPHQTTQYLNASLACWWKKSSHLDTRCDVVDAAVLKF